MGLHREARTEQPDQAGPEDGGWRLFRGDGVARQPAMPPAPPWRRFGPAPDAPETDDGYDRPRPYLISPHHADVINAAVTLRRPLLVTGHPGTGKSSLAHAIAHELGLGTVLRWPVNSRSVLADALYQYDALGRLRQTVPGAAQDPAAEADPGIGDFIRLGPLGTALVPATRPRVLLVDELDKGDIDLPNDLLSVFEEGEYVIPELARLASGNAVEIHTADGGPRVPIRHGRVRCHEFPVVVITSNGERDFPPAFLRRCIRLELPDPDEDRLREILVAHLGTPALERTEELVRSFLSRRAPGELATDQLLNAAFLRLHGVDLDSSGLIETVLHRLGGTV